VKEEHQQLLDELKSEIRWEFLGEIAQEVLPPNGERESHPTTTITTHITTGAAIIAGSTLATNMRTTTTSRRIAAAVLSFGTQWASMTARRGRGNPGAVRQVKTVAVAVLVEEAEAEAEDAKDVVKDCSPIVEAEVKEGGRLGKQTTLPPSSNRYKKSRKYQNELLNQYRFCAAQGKATCKNVETYILRITPVELFA
jgi:hypothetical protein